MKKITPLLALLVNCILFAQDFTLDDIQYSITSSVDPFTVETFDYIGTNTTVTIPAAVTNNGIEYAVTAIGNESFREKSLSSITIPNSIITIGEYAFRENTLSSVTIPSGVVTISKGAFYDNSLNHTLTIPTSVITIGDSAFYENSIDNINLGHLSSNIETIGNAAFRNNTLNGVSIPDSVTYVGTYAFAGNDNMRTANIGSGLEVISNGVFSDCDLRLDYNIPEGITSIGNYAFYRNIRLTSVIIPSTVLTIGDYAFRNTLIGDVYSESLNPATLFDNVFDNNSTINLFIPSGTAAAYTTAGWTGFESVTENTSLHIIHKTFNNTISVSPNPVINTLNISLQMGEALAKAQVYNLLGKEVLSSQITNIDVSNLSSGIYVLKITSTDNKVGVKKFVKK